MCKAMRQICKIDEYFVELGFFFGSPLSCGITNAPHAASNYERK